VPGIRALAFYFGRFERIVQLPDVDAEKLTAELKAKVLEIEADRRCGASEKIEVKSGTAAKSAGLQK
jgi:HSP20 family molecular chaperone IbpA